MKNLIKKNKYLILFFRNNQHLTFFLQIIYYSPKTLRILIKLKFDFISYFKFIDIISLDKSTYFKFYANTNKLPSHDMLIKMHFLLIGFHEERTTNFFMQKNFQVLLPNYENLLFDIKNKITNTKLIKNYFHLINNYEFNKFIKIYLQEFNKNNLWNFDFFNKFYGCIILSNNLEYKKYLDNFLIDNFEFFYNNYEQKFAFYLKKYFNYIDEKNLLQKILDKKNNELKEILKVNINFRNNDHRFLQDSIHKIKNFIYMKDYNSAIELIKNKNGVFSKIFSKSLNKNLFYDKLNKNLIQQDDLDQKFNKNDLVIYTCLFGNYDKLLPVSNHLYSNIKFVCITDDLTVSNDGWENIRLETLESLDSDFLRSRYLKAMPWKYFSEFSHSLYIDSNYIFKNINSLLKIIQECENYDLGIFLHPERNNTFTEIIELIKSEHTEEYKKINILNYFQNYHIKNISSFYEASFIYRKHNDENKNIFNQWWDLILQYPSRDQIFLSDLLENSSIKINNLNEFGNARENIALLRKHHMK